jgi:mitochondrial intermembrane space import and assembly protein 40
MFRTLGRQLINQGSRVSSRASTRRLISYQSARSKQLFRPAGWVIAPVAIGLVGYHYQTSRAFAEEVSIETVEIRADEIPDREVRLLDISDKVEDIQVSETSEEELSDDGAKGAFDPETGEINWDCPCLGGMADGPCGEEFKAAFSCFVYSEAEPKGVDCIEKFQGMQNCFRKYPEIYSEELREDSPIEGEGSNSEGSNSEGSNSEGSVSEGSNNEVSLSEVAKTDESKTEGSKTEEATTLDAEIK